MRAKLRYGRMLELPDWESKATRSNKLRVLMDKVESMQEKMGNVSRQTETLRIKKKH